MAGSALTNLTSATNDRYNIQTNGNGNGNGGTCTGDSRGPLFYGTFDSNTVTAITSFMHNHYLQPISPTARTGRT